jgi:glucokinase
MTTRTAVGVDIGGTTTKAGIVAPTGEVLARLERPTDPSAATKGMLAIVDELLERAPGVDASVVAVGIGAAGFVAGSTVIFSPNLTYDDPQIATAVEARVGLPVAVDNDANAAAWGEHMYGAAQGSNDLALITLGTGTGSGFIVGGRILRGHSGAGAELGHTVIDPSGPECECGLKGCVEQFVSGTAIGRMGREAAAAEPATSMIQFAGSIDDIRAEHVAKAAREYDEVARRVLRRAGIALGATLSNVANLFDPEVIVLAGSVTRSGEAFLGPARDELARRTSAQRRRPMRLDLSTLEGDGGILGAAALGFELAS